MYACQWGRMKEEQQEIEDFIQSSLPQSPSPVLITFFNRIYSSRCPVYDGRLFGLVRCDIAVPESLRAHFSEMPPIFENIEVSREDIGSFMGKYVDEHKLLSQPLSRNGDIDPAKVILAETFKFLGNSAYGKSIENLENPRDVVYSTSEKSGSWTKLVTLVTSNLSRPELAVKPGIRSRVAKNGSFSTTQRRDCSRKVCEDAISTEPLLL
ncbi:hypothetical protein RRG08_065878 [Elysia crispata]|uniref:DNA-directed DNA polymerase n=1 Tax=Elysia crispata TaxID=231223 RepID=A0AAE1DUN1_9GAST|nr:hypothetical protein RRG08_065878 [Elysia crispata]